MSKNLSTFLRTGNNAAPLPVSVGGTGVTTLTGLVKGTGAVALTAAVAGTDYLAPPTGTSLLKANSGGALVNAVAGTDYLAAVAPGTSGNVLTSNGTTWTSQTLSILPTQTGNSGKYLTTDGSAVSWTAPSVVDHIKINAIIPTNLPQTYKRWTTTNLLIIVNNTTVYVYNKSTKSLVNTYVWADLRGFDVLDDNTAIGCSTASVFKITISGNTLTRGTYSTAIPTTSGTNSVATITAVSATSTTQAFITVNYSTTVSGAFPGTSAAAVDISSAIPVIGTISTPTISSQQTESSVYGIYKCSSNQVIVNVRTSGSSGTNCFWVLYGNGTTLTIGDMSPSIPFTVTGSGGGVMAWGNDYDIGGKRGEGYAVPIFKAANGYFYLVGCNVSGQITLLIQIIITANSSTFTMSSINLGNTNNSSNTSPYINYRIYQGTHAEDIIIFWNDPGDYGMKASYVNTAGGTLTLKSSIGAWSSNGYYSTNAASLPSVIVDSVASKISVLSFYYNTSDTTFIPRWMVFTANNSSHTITSSYIDTDNTYLPSGIVYKTKPDLFVTVMHSDPLLFNGSNYLISRDFILSTTDNFMTSANLEIYSNPSFFNIRNTTSYKAIRTVDTNIGIMITHNKTLIFEIA